MNTPIAAIQFNSGRCFCLNRKQLVVLIAFLEVIGSLAAMGSLGFLYYSFPHWKEHAAIPVEIRDDTIILGTINTLVLLCGCRFLISLILLDGTINVKLGPIRFWLTAMLTYKIVICIFVIGMKMARFAVPNINAAVVIIVFIEFIEMLYVYSFVEEEDSRRFANKKISATSLNSSRSAASLEALI